MVLIGIRSALLVRDVISPPEPVGISSGSMAPAAARKVVDVPSILRANLFGQSPVPTGTDAPVTNMNLKLKLVFAGLRDEKHGWAAIGPSDNDVKLYTIGDSVPGGATLHAVYVDRVLLDRGGTIEALLLPPREGAMPLAANTPTVAGGPVSLDRMQQLVRENPNLINQVMQRQAVFQDGKLAGVRVNPGDNRQAFSRLGLRPNDMVTAINGMALDDQARMNEIFNMLNGASQARLTVNRNGREMELNLDLAEIAMEAERLADSPPPSEPDPGPDSTR